jgi:NNP family nitrate/nitrite transporter-like MFS transporter
MVLPTVALMFGGDYGWRYAMIATGAVALVYSMIYYLSVHNTPKGSIYFRPKKSGGMEITGKKDFYLYLLMNVPMYAALALLAWKLSPGNLALLGRGAAYSVYAVLALVYIVQALRIYQINRHVFEKEVPAMDRYEFKQVAVLDLAYFVTFGSELAVVSMLPLFFLATFEQLNPVQAGLLASGYAFTNLFARPGGGFVSDKFGRKKTLIILLAGLATGYLVMSRITPGWPIVLAVLATMACSLFVQSGAGAVFAIVPLVKRRLTGQIAGMAGAYGNVGAVTYLTVLSFVEPSTFFAVIGLSAIIALAAVALLMKEPAGHTAEVLPDGTVQMIEVS